MSDTILYQQNKATKVEIVEHLMQCDADFIPPLSHRVDINEYGAKIFNNASRFEAWIKDTFSGLVAVYCNDPSCKLAYITSVSVVTQSQGKGIASRLMTECIKYTESLGFERVGLEVDMNNLDAIGLYEKKGFVTGMKNGSTSIMYLNIGKET